MKILKRKKLGTIEVYVILLSCIYVGFMSYKSLIYGWAFCIVNFAIYSFSRDIFLFFASNDDDDQDGGKLIKSLERII